MINETPLEQINNKVSAFIDDICVKLVARTISPVDIPLTSLKDIIMDNYLSVASHVDISQLFQDNIRFLLSIIQKAIDSNDKDLCVELLYSLSQTLKVFVYEEKNLQVEFEFSKLHRLFEEFSHLQYDLHLRDHLKHDNSFSGKGVIYTAITGGYDAINEPSYVDPDLDYICFTDNPDLRSDIWNIRLIENPHGLDNIRLARRHKILCEEYLTDYDYSVWVDGKINITGNLMHLVELYHLQSPILCFPHYERDCIYDEARVCGNMGKAPLKDIDHQISKYKSENYPSHNGLVDTCILFRVHNDPDLLRMLSLWWHEVETETVRDQLSFNYACYKSGLTYDLCNMYVYNNPFFTTMDHKA